MEGFALYCAYLWCVPLAVLLGLKWCAGGAGLGSTDCCRCPLGAEGCKVLQIACGEGIQLSGVIPAIKVIPAKQNAVVCLEAAPGPGGDGVALPLLTFYW